MVKSARIAICKKETEVAKVTREPGGRIASYTGLRSSNFHAHFRQDAMMRAVTLHILRHVRYALVMPNTGPILTIEDAGRYYNRLMTIAIENIPRKVDLIMTLYLTSQVTPAIVERMKDLTDQGTTMAVKYYPPAPGATTGSGLGIPLSEAHETLLEMERLGVPLLGHFESTHDTDGRELPHEEREAYMIRNDLWAFRDKYPNLRHSVEHASTRAAVEYVTADTSGNTVMTVTPQHSLFVGADLHEMGTDLKCMPIVKTPEDRAAIVEFITTGDRRAIVGDDTAPHPHKKKAMPFSDAASGCWLPHSLQLYADVFDRAGALDDRFEQFTATNGPDWWGLPRPADHDTITLNRTGEAAFPEPVPIPDTDDVVVPLGWTETGNRLPLSFSVMD